MNIKLENISKKYKNNIVFDNINLNIKSGLIHGLIGLPKSGKSTLIKLITRRCISNNGRILYNDQEMKDKTISVVLCPSSLLTHTKWLKNDYFKDIYPKFDNKYATYLICKFKLYTYKNITSVVPEEIAIYNLIIALACNEDVVLFDDTIDKLSYENKEMFYEELLKKHDEDKQTFIIASKQLNQMKRIFNSYIIINNKEVYTKEQSELLESEIEMCGDNDEF